jgi:2-oxoglutarate ferredoxin oxidoreductase subunit beta
MTAMPKLTRKDFASAEEVRWCPGCADYSVLAQVQKTLPTLGIPKERFVFVSGIGCSSRFPYYLATYGIHGIHGRAPAIATGIKVANPELSVWVVTGDGDGLAIGTSHLVHALRRNSDLKILLLNNRIYGLTKGQISPTSELGKRTKSTPLGSVAPPLDPIAVALGAGATFVARVIATDGAELGAVIARAARHRGAAFIEVLQNCVIFNDGAFDRVAEAPRLYARHGEPLVFGDQAVALEGLIPVPVEKDSPRALIHDERSEMMALLLSRLPAEAFPPVLGVLRAIERPTYDARVEAQVAAAQKASRSTLQGVLEAGDTWTVEAR